MKHSTFHFSWLLLLGVVTAMSSCQTYSFTSRTQQVNGGRISQTKKAVDVEADFSRLISVVGDWAMSANAAKLSAEYKAITENKIDVFVDPIYKITVAPVFNTTDGAPWYTMSYRAEAVGYAGMFKKEISQEDQINQLKDVDKADIEKFKLLNEPDFYKYYYNTKKGDINGNVIIGGGGLPNISSVQAIPVEEVQPAGLPILKDVASPKEVKTMSEKQIRDMILTGKAFVGIGATMVGVGAICGISGAAISAQYKKKYGSDYKQAMKYYGKYYQCQDLALASWCLAGIGGGLALVIGTPCWVVGEKKLQTANGNIAFNYNVSPTGMNLAFKF